MNRILILAAITIFIIFAFKAAREARPISKSVGISGDYASIRHGDIFIRGKMQPEATEEFLVNNGFDDEKSDGEFFVIPMEKANAIKASYGDFVHCDSPGASAAKENLQKLVLFTTDQQIREKIKEVIKRSLNSPVVEIRGSKLEVEEHTIGNNKFIQFGFNMPENYYLVKDIRITQEHYQ